MKIWHKTKKEEFGHINLVWRHKATGRFCMKIATWMLGGFVFGMVTAIAVDTAGLHELSLSAARTVFFIVFVKSRRHSRFASDLHDLFQQSRPEQPAYSPVVLLP